MNDLDLLNVLRRNKGQNKVEGGYCFCKSKSEYLVRPEVPLLRPQVPVTQSWVRTRALSGLLCENSQHNVEGETQPAA